MCAEAGGALSLHHHITWIYDLSAQPEHVKAMLDIWPPLPIAIWGFGSALGASRSQWECVDNIVATLKHNDRVCKIELECIQDSLLERIVAVTKGPFPALTRLCIILVDAMPPVTRILEALIFLGGSAPHRRSCIMLHTGRYISGNIGNSFRLPITLSLFSFGAHSMYFSLR